MGRENVGGRNLRRQARTQGTSAQDVINDAGDVNFNDEAAWTKFQDKHKARLNKGPTSSWAEDEVLHLIAQDTDGFSKHREFTKWVVEHHKQLLKCKDRAGFPPLHLALFHYNHGFVALVLEYAGEICTLLEQYTGSALTCLHRAICHRSPFTEVILDIIQGAPRTNGGIENRPIIGATRNLAGADGGIGNLVDSFTVRATEASHEDTAECIGMTALHLAAASESSDLEDEDDYTECLSSLGVQPKLEDTDTRPPPPHSSKAKAVADGAYIIPIARVNTSNLRRDSNLVSSPIYDNDKSMKPPELKLSRYDDIRGSARTRSPIKSEFERFNPTLVGEPLVQTKNRPQRFNLLAVVKKLVSARPEVLFCRDNADDTPFQARMRFLQGTGTNAKDRREIIKEDEILRFMREYIIDKYDRREAMRALYPVGEERVLEFNLSGLPYSTIDSDFLNGLGKVLRFEGLLKYVAIPQLTVEIGDELDAFEPEADDLRNTNDTDQVDKTKGKGSTHMYSIFKWLERNHVDSILEVTVVDNAEPYHSDEVIEACLYRFDVRVWNWYKVDLCCQVILNAARNVTDVTLYSSGNNAVLTGWSSSSGLAMLPKLERVHINVQEGLERPKRLQGYMASFKAELRKYKPDVTFTWRLHKPSQDYDAVFAKQGKEDIAESKWMKSMREFSTFLATVKPNHPIDPIKIAVIDDGLKATSNIFMDKIQVGESFAPLSGLSGRSGAYYVPSGPHGTLMAELICEVCPVVKLYIAQLEVLPGQDGRRSFTPESATEAINWAISQKVDIISMSWSIHSNGRTYSALEAALLEAVREHILMFCSSIDEGPTAPDNTYPGKEQNCIKIGAATGNGTKLSWVSEAKSDFFLPGEAIQTSDMKVWGQTQAGVFGSSVATAVAAGLAGSLIYCERLLATQGTSSAPKEIPMDLKSSSNMKNAFKNLAMGTENSKFVQPWPHLTPQDDKPLVWDENYDPDRTMATRQKLEAFVNFIKNY